VKAGQPCKTCGTPYSKRFIEQKEALRVERVKRAQKAAIANGMHIGRPKAHDYDQLKTLRAKGLTFRKIRELTGASIATIHRVCS
jgi:DNA invertase Pin-like site-specific DNA recombinase